VNNGEHSFAPGNDRCFGQDAVELDAAFRCNQPDRFDDLGNQ
jgi:hypothetical protein